MRNRTLFILILMSMLAFCTIGRGAEQGPDTAAFVGQDLHMEGPAVISHQLSTSEHILVFREGFSMSIGANKFSSSNAVVWLIPRSAVPVESTVPEQLKVGDWSRIGYKTMVYLRGALTTEKSKGALTTSLSGTVIEKGRVMAVQAGVSGGVFISADRKSTADPTDIHPYNFNIDRTATRVRSRFSPPTKLSATGRVSAIATTMPMNWARVEIPAAVALSSRGNHWAATFVIALRIKG